MFALMRDIAIGIGLVLLIPLALIYGIGTLMKPPSYPRDESIDFAYRLKELKKKGLEREIETIKKNLENIKKELEIKEKELQKKVPEEEIKAAEEQLANAKKEFEEKVREYNKAMDKYDWNRLLISVSIGSITALIGAMLIESLGTGLVFGGVVCIIYGFLLYWGSFNDLIRFAILIGAVLLLFILGYWRFIRTKHNYVIS